MNVTRRKLMGMVAAATPAAALGGVPASASRAICGLQFYCWNTLFPILYENEPIEFRGHINKWEFSLPLSGEFRRHVNPSAPKITGNEISFAVPGEYYLKFNDGECHLKVCVLQRAEPTFNSLARIFDFTVANMLLPGAYHFVNLHKSQVLAESAIAWIESISNLEVTTTTADSMRAALRDGHRSEIASARWWGNQR